MLVAECQVESTQAATVNKEDVFHIFLDLTTLGFMMLSNYLSLNRGMVLADQVECGVMCLFIIYQCYPELLVFSPLHLYRRHVARCLFWA